MKPPSAIQFKNTKTFVVWNNKGGMGKSTLIFNIVCEYALQFPDRKFLVIDMCPQANSTAFFLGGRTGVQKAEKLMQLDESVENEDEIKTIYGYIARVVDGKRDVDPNKYLITPGIFVEGRKVPKNIQLLCGDRALDLAAPFLEQEAQRVSIMDKIDRFHHVHSVIREFIFKVTEDSDKWVVFVDANPAFTIYTRIALCSANELLVACNANEFSTNAIKVITGLLSDYDGNKPPYNVDTFATLAKMHGLVLPKLRLVIANRFMISEENTPLLYQEEQLRLAKNFIEVLRNSERDFLQKVRVSKGNYITGTSITDEQFATYCTCIVPMFHSAIAYSSYSGEPISTMNNGTYSFEGKQAQLSPYSIIGSSWAIQYVVCLLEQEISDFKYAKVRYEMGNESKYVVRKRPIPLRYKYRDLKCINEEEIVYVDDTAQRRRKFYKK